MLQKVLFESPSRNSYINFGCVMYILRISYRYAFGVPVEADWNHLPLGEDRRRKNVSVATWRINVTLTRHEIMYIHGTFFEHEPFLYSRFQSTYLNPSTCSSRGLFSLAETFCGLIIVWWLIRYLTEYCYRFNRRLWESQLFGRLLKAVINTCPVIYAELAQ